MNQIVLIIFFCSMLSLPRPTCVNLQNNLRRLQAQQWEVIISDCVDTYARVTLPWFYCTGFCSCAALFPIEKIKNNYATNEDKSGFLICQFLSQCTQSCILLTPQPVSVIQTARSMLEKGGLAGLYQCVRVRVRVRLGMGKG